MLQYIQEGSWKVTGRKELYVYTLKVADWLGGWWGGGGAGGRGLGVNLPKQLTIFNDNLSVRYGCIYDIVTLWLKYKEFFKV